MKTATRHESLCHDCAYKAVCAEAIKRHRRCKYWCKPEYLHIHIRDGESRKENLDRRIQSNVEDAAQTLISLGGGAAVLIVMAAIYLLNCYFEKICNYIVQYSDIIWTVVKIGGLSVAAFICGRILWLVVSNIITIIRGR